MDPPAFGRGLVMTAHPSVNSGLDVVTSLCERLLEGGAPGLHIYTLNRANASMLLWQRLNR